MSRTFLSPRLWEIDVFLSTSECSQLVSRAEDSALEQAPIIAVGGNRIDVVARNNDRLVFEDSALLDIMWHRLIADGAWTQSGRAAAGLNERLRLYRYRPGQHFDWHADMPYQRQDGQRSLLTLLVYLNDDYEGGETRFESRTVNPRAGSALVFEHGLVHKGNSVQSGLKFALRTDVMFLPRGNAA